MPIVRGNKVSDTMRQRARALRKAMTPEETTLWQVLRTNRLGGLHFRRQQIIGEYIADFYCHQSGVIVELDGEIHRRQTAYDEERDLILASRGLRILRIPNAEVRTNLPAVLALIQQTCQTDH